MRFLFLHVLLLIPSIMLAVQKDSIFISQFVRDSFTQYGVRNAFVTVMNLEGYVLIPCVHNQEMEVTMLRYGNW